MLHGCTLMKKIKNNKTNQKKNKKTNKYLISIFCFFKNKTNKLSPNKKK